MIEMNALEKTYITGAVEFQALKLIDLTINKGEYVSIVGPSGSGKSTMMNIIGCLDIPTGGSYKLDGEDVGKMSSNQLADIRNRTIGFVFQAFNLLPYATAYENVEVPLLFAKANNKERERRIIELLNGVGLGNKLNNKPTEMSGGGRQRVAIARALACNPDIILADEPTGNLDTASGSEIVKIFDELHEMGKTVVMITHDMSIADKTDRIIKIRDGLIESDGYHKKAS
ncbi:MAG: ABC transporter ATP-binding protein [Calditrichaeota bacterium]|nr:MAG: ABC transporter ATP-binding protein [Calditrichota bacterium]